MKKRNRILVAVILMVIVILIAIGVAGVVAESLRANAPITSPRFTFTCDVEEIVTGDEAGRLACTPDKRYDVTRQVTIDVHNETHLERMRYLSHDSWVICYVEYRVPRNNDSGVTRDMLRSPYLLLRDRPDLDRYLKLITLCDGLPCVLEQR